MAQPILRYRCRRASMPPSAADRAHGGIPRVYARILAAAGGAPAHRASQARDHIVKWDHGYGLATDGWCSLGTTTARRGRRRASSRGRGLGFPAVLLVDPDRLLELAVLGAREGAERVQEFQVLLG